MPKPKVAFYWCASCGGCEEAVVDLNEEILTVTEAVEIVFWPVALDFKKKDVEAMADNSIAISFINGAVRTDEQLEMVEMLRRKSGLVVAFGSCAHLGGIPGLANFHDRDAIFKNSYIEAASVVNPENVLPRMKVEQDGKELTLPKFWDTVKALDQVTEVDYYLPGCPPAPDLIANAVSALLRVKLPSKGAVLAPEKALCDTCPLAEKKPERLAIKEIKRPHEIEHDPEQCFLTEGIICLGPATRSGCGERCILANMPCRGCMGPIGGVEDNGIKILSAIAAALGIEGEEDRDDDETRKLINQVVDPGGTFYRFSLPKSILHRKKMKTGG